MSAVPLDEQPANGDGGRRKPVQARGRDTRQALLDAAMELVAERGLAAASHREVAKRAGCNVGMTSYFFRSIEELTYEAMAYQYAKRIDEYRATTSALATLDVGPLEMIDLVTTAISSASLERVGGHFEIVVAASRRSDLRALLTTYLAELDNLILAVVEALGMPEPESYVRTIAAVFDGLQIRRLSLGDPNAETQMRDALRMIYFAAVGGRDDHT